MAELSKTTREDATEGLFGAYSQHQPVDVLISYALTPDDQFEIQFLTAANREARRFDAGIGVDAYKRPEVLSLAETTRKAIQIIVDGLPISADDRKVLTEQRITTPGVFAPVYRSRCYPLSAIVPGSRKAGYAELRLRALKSAWGPHLTERHVSAEVLKSAYELFTADPEVKNETYLVDWVRMAEYSFSGVLGTRFESVAYPLAEIAPRRYLKKILALARPLTEDFMDAAGLLDDDSVGGDILGDLAAKMEEDTPRTKRLGAVRLLGILNQPESTELLAQAVSHDEADVREAAAFAAGRLPPPAGAEWLHSLQKDTNQRVAFAAAVALWERGAPPPNLVELAVPFAEEASELGGRAVATLAELAPRTKADVLARIGGKPGPHRVTAICARLGLGALPADEYAILLHDVDTQVLTHTLDALGTGEHTADLSADLKRLAVDPFPPVAQGARALLARQQSTDPWERMTAELDFEHPYVIGKTLDRIAEDPDPRALDLLVTACGNRDDQVRAKALCLLAERASQTAAPLVAQGLSDPSGWVRFHAASIAPMVAAPGMAATLEGRLTVEQDAATRLYLRDALAKAKGEPAPEPPPRARSVAGEKNLAWNTSPALYAPDSPFEAYYSMHIKVDVHMRAAHDAGKIIFARAAPIRSPGMIVVNQAAREECWRQLDQMIDPDTIMYLDGILYGEETMALEVDGLWPDGWTLFCRDAGIPLPRVAGQLENLTPSERRAWGSWAAAINIKGFNELHDYTKRKFGKLRPGLQVATFLPGEKPTHPSAPEALLQWKFDVGGVYDYKGDNRMACYNLIRRYKTLWPDRPVIWLSLGIGGYEMNPVQYGQKVPEWPMLDRYNRSFSDSLTAWLAGADTGWFSTWLFMNPTKGSTRSMSRLRGVHIWVEDIGPHSDVLERGIRYCMVGHDKLKPPAPPAMPTAVDLDSDLGDVIDEEVDDILNQTRAKNAQARSDLDAKLAQRGEALKLGFLYYQQYVYDCARIFSSLPRQNSRPAALAIRPGVNVWTRPEHKQYPLVPAQALLNTYDFLLDINVVGHIDLSGYRMIVVHDPGAIRDRTILAITQWLRETPGLLVIHRNIPNQNTAEAGTVDDHDGKLDHDWPWEHAVSIVEREPPSSMNRDHPLSVDFGNGPQAVSNAWVGSHFELTDPSAQSLAKVSNATVLALWQDPGRFKGSVIFDGVLVPSGEYLDGLRSAIVKHVAEVADLVSGPALLETLTTPTFAAVAATRYFNAAKGITLLPGVDVMTGHRNPNAGQGLGSRSALTVKNYVSRCLAASSRITALSWVPFSEAKIEGDDLRLQCPSVVRVVTADGHAKVLTDTGDELPSVEPNQLAAWLFESTDDGVYVTKRREEAEITFYRSRTPVVVRVE